MLTARWLDRAESRSTLAAWRAAHAAGYQIEIVDDHEIGMASSSELPGPAFNQAYGFAGLPNLLSTATRFYDRHGSTGYVWLEDEPWPDAKIELTLGIFGSAPEDTPDLQAPRGVVIRRIDAGEIDKFNAVTSGDDAPGGVDLGSPNPWPTVYEHLVRTHARQLFIAEIDGRPVADASLHISGKTGWLRGATVAPEARGRGIQRALISFRARAAAEAGCNLIGASAEPDEISARNLEAMGMRRVATRSAFVYEPGSRRA
jgi:GNAT superfamily N-acetyltransferase